MSNYTKTHITKTNEELAKHFDFPADSFEPTKVGSRIPDEGGIWFKDRDEQWHWCVKIVEVAV